MPPKSTLTLRDVPPALFAYLDKYRAHDDTPEQFALALLMVAMERSDASTKLI